MLLGRVHRDIDGITKDQAEFLATGPRDHGIGSGERRFEATRKMPEHLVADDMTMAIVDRLEVKAERASVSDTRVVSRRKAR